MKKLFNAVFLSAMAVGVTSVPSFAKAADWTLNAPQEVDFVCGGSIYNHTLTNISVADDGSFTGSGMYDADNSITWDIAGNITGTTVTFTLVYTGVNPGYTLNGSGTISTDGSIAGALDGNCETFSMDASVIADDDGDKEKKANHGQYVKSQEDKRAAAHSREGMPAHSKGHTKTK